MLIKFKGVELGLETEHGTKSIIVGYGYNRVGAVREKTTELEAYVPKAVEPVMLPLVRLCQRKFAKIRAGVKLPYAVLPGDRLRAELYDDGSTNQLLVTRNEPEATGFSVRLYRTAYDRVSMSSVYITEGAREDLETVTTLFDVSAFNKVLTHLTEEYKKRHKIVTSLLEDTDED